MYCAIESIIGVTTYPFFTYFCFAQSPIAMGRSGVISPPHRSSIDCYIFIIHLNKNNVMSKTAQTLIDKAASLAEGMKRNMDKAQQLGIDNAYIARLEAEMDTLRATDRAVEEAAAHIAELRARNNEAMRLLRDDVQNAKKAVKGRYDKLDWHTFGIADKQ